MKIETFILLLLLAFLAITLTYDTKQDTLVHISLVNERYDSILEHASDDAVEALVKLDAGKNPDIQKDEAVSVFFHSLYAGFGVMGDPEAQEELKTYIPLIAVLDKDGVYFWYHGTYQDNGTNYAEMWSEKYPYSKSYTENGTVYYVSYGMDDFISLMASNAYSIQEGTYTSIQSNYPGLSFLSKEVFEEERRAAIIDTVTEHMTSYINSYNRIALQEEIGYQFLIPYLTDAEWSRTIDDISFLVFFQGYPYGNFTTERYNQFEVSCARTKKSDKYYITQENGTKYYHRSGCGKVDMDTMQPYDSKRKCALQGAYPCTECTP